MKSQRSNSFELVVLSKATKYNLVNVRATERENGQKLSSALFCAEVEWKRQ